MPLSTSLFALATTLLTNQSDPLRSGITTVVPRRVQATAVQLLDFAESAQRRGDLGTAEKAYRAVAADPALSIRTEARFRLGMLYASAGRLSAAALEFRRILDEQPRAQRVRLELAQVLDRLGDDPGARRALREAQAEGLPPDVARVVDRYSAALRARKPFGASLEMAIAPDSNINRATRSDTLGTVIGDFTLDKDAKQRSGIGLALRGQLYARLALSQTATLLGRVSSSADLYRDEKFNDVAIGVSAGPELRLGSDRLAVEVGVVRRSFGNKPLATTAMLGANYNHPLSRVAQLRATASVGKIEHKLNPLQGGKSYFASLALECALSATTGMGASVAFDRQLLRDPGYSTSSKQVTAFAYHELGPTTLVASLGHGRVAADERLNIYPERRRDRLYRASLSATLRQFKVGGLAPFVRISRELNRSSVEIFEYRRTRTEFGVARAF